MERFFYVLLFCSVIRSASAEITNSEIENFFTPEGNRGEILDAYISQVQVEIAYFEWCARSSQLSEALNYRSLGVEMQTSREALLPGLLKFKDSHPNESLLFERKTREFVDKAYQVALTCAAHAANLKILAN